MEVEKKYKQLVDFIKIFNKFEDKNDIVNLNEDEENILNEFINNFTKNDDEPIDYNSLPVLGTFEEDNIFCEYGIDYLNWCTFKYMDADNNVLDNFYEMSYEELFKFNKHNIAPYMAEKIGVYYKNKIIGFINLGNLKKEFDERLYRVGLMSDIHYNDTSVDIDPYTIENYDYSEYDTDLENALSYYQDNEEIEFMCAAGDISTDSKEHLRNFSLNLKTKAPDTPFYSCLGNHDFQATHWDSELYNIEFDASNELMTRLEIWNNHITANDESIHYFDETTEEGNLSYYIERNIPGTNKTDIYLFLSVDYGVDKNTIETKSGWEIKGAQKMLNYEDTAVQELMEYINSNERTELQQQYDYQFYNNDVLLWVKDLIENNQGKRIFLFTHQFFSQKAGNNNSGEYYAYSNDYWRITQKDEYQLAYCLCGLQFEFMNKLNNEYHNVIWFTGHSHYSWKWQLTDSTINICNNDYAIVDPKNEDFDKELRYRRIENSYEPISDSAYNIHLPSLSRPIHYYSTEYEVGFIESEGAIMDIYEEYVDIRGIIFKETNDYENKYYPLAQYRLYIPAGE